MEVRLYARPYIVTPQDDEAITRLNDPDGIKLRHWDTLKEAVEHLQKGQADEHGGSGQESGLSRTVQHDLRSALFEGRSATDARLHLINGRLKGCQFGPLLHGAEVFFDLPDYENGGRKQSAAGSSTRSVTATRLLDAMDIVEFWSGEG
jgi:hypothetical protein